MRRAIIILGLLLCAIPSHAAIARDGHVTAATTSGTFTATATGDLKLVWAIASGVTAPTVPATFTSILTVGTTGGSGSSNITAVLACNVSSSSGDTSTGTFTGATELVGTSYSGTAVGTNANCNTTGVGTTVTNNLKASTTMSYLTMTLSNTSGSSWAAGFGGDHASPTCNPTTMTNVTTAGTGPEATANDTNTGASSWATATCTVTSSAWVTGVVEILASTPCTVCFDAVGPSSSGTSVASGSASWTTFTLTWTHVITCASNCVLCVGAAFEPGSSSIVTLGATFNGTAMTSEGSAIPDNQPADGLIQLFCSTSPTNGSHSVVLTATYVSGTESTADDILGGSVSFTGAGSVAHANTAFGNTISPAVAVTSASGDMVVDVSGSGHPVSKSNKTLRWNLNLNNTLGAGNAAQSTAAGATSVTMGYTLTVADFWGMVGLDVVAASAAGSCTSRIALLGAGQC